MITLAENKRHITSIKQKYQNKIKNTLQEIKTSEF